MATSNFTSLARQYGRARQVEQASLNRAWNCTRALICLLLVLVTLGIYWQIHGFSFLNFDDFDYVTENPAVKQGFPSRESFGRSRTFTRAPEVRPALTLKLPDA